MKRAFLFGFALAGVLLGCGERSKGLAAADSTRIAAFADTGLETAVRETLNKPAGPLTPTWSPR